MDAQHYVDYLAEFAIRFCTVVFFGETLAEGRLVSNPVAGTVTLLEIEHRRFFVTNDYVLTEYEKLQDANTSRVHFQVGRMPFDPQAHLIARDARLDLCTFCADGQLASDITDRLSIDPIPPLEYYRATTWPPNPPALGERLVWAGFPGSLRHIEDNMRWTVPLAFTGPRVARVEDDLIICNEDPERKDWVAHHSQGLTPTSDPLQELGGMSGGPVFRIDDCLRPELIGVISQYHRTVNQMRIARIDALQSDGRLLRR